jgi:hypothetical protein
MFVVGQMPQRPMAINQKAMTVEMNIRKSAIAITILLTVTRDCSLLYG